MKEHTSLTVFTDQNDFLLFDVLDDVDGIWILVDQIPPWFDGKSWLLSHGSKFYMSWQHHARGIFTNGTRATKEEKFMTVNELAQYFRVNPKPIYQRLWAKALPAYKVGRVWKIAPKDLKWLRQ